GADYDRSHAVIEHLVAHPAEVLEGVLVGTQKLLQALIAESLGPGPARVAERHHEDVHLGRSIGERHAGLTPVDLCLLAGRGLESTLRQRLGCRLSTQRTHCVSDRVVTAAIAALAAQLLEQNLRRIGDLRRTLL